MQGILFVATTGILNLNPRILAHLYNFLLFLCLLQLERCSSDHPYHYKCCWLVAVVWPYDSGRLMASHIRDA